MTKASQSIYAWPRTSSSQLLSTWSASSCPSPASRTAKRSEGFTSIERQSALRNQFAVAIYLRFPKLLNSSNHCADHSLAGAVIQSSSIPQRYLKASLHRGTSITRHLH